MSEFETPPGSGTTVNLSLISHTNAGKTTLARTLLGRELRALRPGARTRQRDAQNREDARDDVGFHPTWPERVIPASARTSTPIRRSARGRRPSSPG